MTDSANPQLKIALLDIYANSLIVLDRLSGEIIYTLSEVGFPDGVQVDVANGYFYWTDMGAHRIGEAFPDADGRVLRCRIDGSDRTVLVGEGAVYTPKQIHLDVQQQQLYWSDREGAKVMRCRVDGSGLVTLVKRGKSAVAPHSKLDECVGIAVDKVGGHIYWSQKGPAKGGQGRLFRAGIDIPAGEQAWNRSDIELLADHLPEPIDLEIDEQNRLLYWTDRGMEPDGNSLNRATFGPSGLTGHEVLVRGFHEAIGLTLDKPRNKIFVADLSGQIVEIDLQTLQSSVRYSASKAVTGLSIF
jgi:hypothetical protein